MQLTPSFFSRLAFFFLLLLLPLEYGVERCAVVTVKLCVEMVHELNRK